VLTEAAQRDGSRPSRVQRVVIGAIVVLVAASLPWAGSASANGSAPEPATTLAVIKAIPVGVRPSGVDVNQADDTIYVTNGGSGTVSVINGRTGMVDDTIAVGAGATDVAVNQADDTVYVANAGSDNVSVINGRTRMLDDTIAVGDAPYGVAVDQDDDTVYAANSYSGNVSVINGRTGVRTDDTITSVGARPQDLVVDDADDTVYGANYSPGKVWMADGQTRAVTTIVGGGAAFGVAINQEDDTVYSPNNNSSEIWVINGRTGTVEDTIPVGLYPYGVAVDQADDTVYTANDGSNSISVINGHLLDDSFTVSVGSKPRGVAVDDSGMVYVTHYETRGTVSVIARVTPSLTPSGPAGSPVTLSVDVPQAAAYPQLDDSTVVSVMFGNDAVAPSYAGKVAGKFQWTVTAPPSGVGTVDVVATFNGGLTASAGQFTFADPAPDPTPPSPAPVFPPSAPLDVAGDAGDGTASITWRAPAFTGSFPVTSYEVQVSPGGKSCLAMAPTLTCQITGLGNGNEYTASVRALNGAGWGPDSAPSRPFTPRATEELSITITGTRGDVRGKPGIIVTGSTTGFGIGAILRPWLRFPGQAYAIEGTASILVSLDGTFTWERRTGKKVSLTIRSTDGAVISNPIALAP